jgi:ankyrin repeat protein
MKYLQTYEIKPYWGEIYNSASVVDRLFNAIHLEDIEIIKDCLRYNPNVNEQDHNGNTPLIVAIQVNSGIEIIKLLIEAGANLDIQNLWGTTALISASSLYNLELLKILIEAGADWSIENKEGETFIFKLLKDPGKEEMLGEIIETYPEKFEEYKIKRAAKKYNL